MRCHARGLPGGCFGDPLFAICCTCHRNVMRRKLEPDHSHNIGAEAERDSQWCMELVRKGRGANLLPQILALLTSAKSLGQAFLKPLA
jgi:hypothetical protein